MINSVKTISYRLAFIFFVLTTMLQAQEVQRLQYPVEFAGKALKLPWTGGLNAPQFSTIDLNGDNQKDLYVFDRIGNVSLTFVNEGGVGESEYSFAPQFQQHFPDMKNFVLLRDYNGDGLEDIFCYSLVPGVSGFSVFTATQEAGHVAYVPFQFNFNPNVLPFDQGNGFFTNIYVAPTDYPGIIDVDQDGDLDILTFDLGGTVMYYYENQSFEQGYGLDSLIFILEDDCWGRFKESGISAEVKLSDNPDECAEGLQTGTGGVRHAGSTVLPVDLNGDNNLDMILGDLFNQHLTYLHNEGSSVEAWMNEQDNTFPSYDLPVDMAVFNAGFSIDVNNDGLFDLLAAPNSINLIEDTKGVWFYPNTGTASQPEFSFQQDDFLIEEMIDFGTGANPAFADVNQDGLIDIVVGNFSYYKQGGVKDSRLALLLNIGTAENPAFVLEDDNWLDFLSFSGASYDFAPTFGDLDADGDLDLLVGEQQGGLFFLQNNAGPGNPMSFGPPQYPYMGIDKGQSTTPQIVDLNRDGLMDIVLGERNGFLSFFQNIGTPQVPEFNADANTLPNINKLGGVDTRGLDPTQGYSAPFFIDFEGTYMLFCGSVNGGIHRYTNIDGNLEGDFTEETTAFGNLHEGSRTHISFADINQNGQLELVVGNFRGGVALFETPYLSDGSLPVKDNTAHFDKLLIFPNPASDKVWIEMNQLHQEKGGKWAIFNVFGQIICAGKTEELPKWLAVNDWKSGVYYLKVQTRNGQLAEQKILIH